MSTKSIKVTVKYSKDNIMEKDDFFSLLKDLQYNAYKGCNQTISYLYQNDMQNLLRKDLDIPKEGDKLIYGKRFSSWIENRLNDYMPGALTTNVAQTRQFVISRYNNDKKAGLLKGNVSLTRFKRDIPIIIHNKAYTVISTEKGLGLEIGFFNTSKQSELGIKRIKFLLPKLGGYEKTIIRRLFEGSYKQGSCQILYNKRKKKWQVAISYTFENKTEGTNSSLIMGIDLGIIKIATISIFNSHTNKYEFMNFNERCIDGKELIAYRQRFENRIKSSSIASKWASKNNTGKGYKARTALQNSLGDKYSRFRETYNHKISRYIVNLAIKYKVSIIQMENLSGFSDEQDESLLKNWSYYDLQQKIKYKATEVGIEAYFISPKYTSQRCSKCGNIHKDNRLTQEEFKCLVCNYTDNADINASKNISIPSIENIIQEYMKYTCKKCYYTDKANVITKQHFKCNACGYEKNKSQKKKAI